VASLALATARGAKPCYELMLNITPERIRECFYYYLIPDRRNLHVP